MHVCAYVYIHSFIHSFIHYFFVSLSTRSLHRCKRFNEGANQAHNLQHQNKTLTSEGYKGFRHEVNESATCKMEFENQDTYLCRTDDVDSKALPSLAVAGLN